MVRFGGEPARVFPMRFVGLFVWFITGCATCLAQRPVLPEFNFDRRGNPAYSDSLLTLGRNNLRYVEQLPRTRHNDTLRLDGLRYLISILKQLRGPLRDSSYVYAQRLEKRALAYGNVLFTVRAVIQQEYYLRTVKGDYPQALRLNLRAQELCKQLPRELSPHWQTLMNTGDIYVLQKQYDHGLANYGQALELLRYNTLLTPKNRKLFAAHLKVQMGEVYETQGYYDLARQQFEACQQIARETRSQVNIAYAGERLGDFFISRQQPERAIPIFEEALSIWTRLDDRAGQALVWARLAECFTLTNQPGRAIEFGEKALSVTRLFGYRRVQQMATQALYRAYKAAGQPAQALLMHEEYVTLRDSLANRRQVEELAAVQRSYDLNQMRAEAEQARFVQQQQLLSMRRQAEIDRLRAAADHEQMLNQAHVVQLRQRVETERLRAISQKTRLEQQARISALNQDIDQQRLTRAFLMGGLAMLLIFGAAYYRKSRLIARQKVQIEALNRGLEDKVARRTLELQLVNDQLRAKNREIEEALLRGQTLERKRMAADLHDSLGGLLAAIKTSLSALNPAQLSEREQQIYRNLLNMTKEAFAEVRYLSHNLQPEVLEKQGLAEALNRLIDKLNLTRQVNFRLEIAELPRLDKTTEFNLYSICIELCSNILRHSEATQAAILFRRFGSELNMIIQDNGCGMDPADATGMGLRNIQGRMDLIQGRYEIHSSVGEGTTFIFILPVPSDKVTA